MAPIVHLFFTGYTHVSLYIYIHIYNMNLKFWIWRGFWDPYSASKIYSGWSRSYFCYQVFGWGQRYHLGCSRIPVTIRMIIFLGSGIPICTFTFHEVSPKYQAIWLSQASSRILMISASGDFEWTDSSSALHVDPSGISQIGRHEPIQTLGTVEETRRSPNGMYKIL